MNQPKARAHRAAQDRAAYGPEATDGELVREILAGRKEAFALLVRRYQDALYRHARAIGLDGDTASDLVQDTLVRAYEGLSDCRDPDRFRVWVSRILRNRCLDHLKSPAARKRVPIPLAQPSTDVSPALRTEWGSIREIVDSALARLPAEQREAFVLKHVEERSYEEMAETAGASVSAMKMRVHRAREFLRSQLELAGIHGPA